MKHPLTSEGASQAVAISHVFQTPQEGAAELKYFMLSSPSKTEGSQAKVRTWFPDTFPFSLSL